MSLSIEDEDSIIIGYINDNGFDNNFDLIIAEIIDLNIKGYLSIEYSKDQKYDYVIKQNIDKNIKDAKEYDLLVLDFLFSKNLEITKSMLEEKMLNCFKAYDLQFNQIKECIENEIINKGIIKKIKKEKQRIKLNLSNLKLNDYTDYGKYLKNQITEYKQELENKEFLTFNKNMSEIINDKEFSISLALHINTIAKNTFIDNKIKEKAKENSIKIIKMLIIVSLLIPIVAILLGIALKSIGVVGSAWFLIIIAIGIAAWADITKEIGMLKKHK